MNMINRVIPSLILVIISLTLLSCLTAKSRTYNKLSGADPEVLLDTTYLFDQSRNRDIPIAIYKPKDEAAKKQPIVIFSHGYGENKGGTYLIYSYLTKFLASKDFFVVSVQHELPADSLIPSNGIPQVVRRPFWDRGTDNILFVINALKKSNPQLDFNNITLIGHSNGADMTALFPQKYPGIIRTIITLDNRRMPLPKTSNPKVYSLRSNDQPADAGVLPTEEEQKRFGITIVKLSNTKHNDMNDFGSDAQHTEINNYISEFLTGK